MRLSDKCGAGAEISHPGDTCHRSPAAYACDTFARLLGHKMGERLGQTLVADNRPGAGGTIGLSMTASAPADG